MSEHCVVLVTCPDRKTGMKIGTSLVEDRLAACVNVIDGVTSIYRWEKDVLQDPETMLIIKTRRAHFAEVERRVLDLHPYDVPEIICAEISAGNIPYLNWIDESTR